METPAPDLPSASHPLVVLTQNQPAPGPLAAFEPVRAAARSQGWGLSLLIYGLDPESTKIMAKRRHDAQGACRTLSLAVEAIQGGYRFDDDTAALKLAAIGKAVQVIERELPLLMKALGGV